MCSKSQNPEKTGCKQRAIGATQSINRTVFWSRTEIFHQRNAIFFFLVDFFRRLCFPGLSSYGSPLMRIHFPWIPIEGKSIPIDLHAILMDSHPWKNDSHRWDYRLKIDEDPLNLNPGCQYILFEVLQLSFSLMRSCISDNEFS